MKMRSPLTLLFTASLLAMASLPAVACPQAGPAGGQPQAANVDSLSTAVFTRITASFEER